MRASNHDVIRTVLHEHLDGLTVSELSAYTHIPNDSLAHALKAMPDTYIDRWTVGKFQSPSSAVWCAVEVPENCPKPKPKGRKNATNRN